jgi:putative oxidoreductase
MRGIGGINPDWGVTAVRVMTGLLFAVHGYQKFAGGIGGVSAFFTKVAIPLPGAMAPFIASLNSLAVSSSSWGLGPVWSGACLPSRCS